MHLDALGDGCRECYIRDSSFHRSYYRCIALHSTNHMLVTENVAYDVVGHCYFLGSGTEVDNTLSFNLAAHIHSINPANDQPGGSGQLTNVYQQGPTLAMPADVTAAGFFLPNIQNKLIGNAASGVGINVPQHISNPLDDLLTEELLCFIAGMGGFFVSYS